MTLPSYQIPILNNPSSSEDPKTHDALQQIFTILSGGIDSSNVTDGSLAGTDLAPSEAWRVIGSAGQPAFTNGWTANTGYQIRFKKDLMGFVHLTGVMLPGTFGQSAFTLPTGYLPRSGEDLHFSVVSNNAPAVTYITSAGLVIPLNGSISTDLAGIHYLAEA